MNKEKKSIFRIHSSIEDELYSESISVCSRIGDYISLGQVAHQLGVTVNVVVLAVFQNSIQTSVEVSAPESYMNNSRRWEEGTAYAFLSAKILYKYFQNRKDIPTNEFDFLCEEFKLTELIKNSIVFDVNLSMLSISKDDLALVIKSVKINQGKLISRNSSLNKLELLDLAINYYKAKTEKPRGWFSKENKFKIAPFYKDLKKDWPKIKLKNESEIKLPSELTFTTNYGSIIKEKLRLK